MFSGLLSTGQYFNQVLSLSTTPIGSFTSQHWIELKDLIMSLLTNPFFYGVIGIILIMTILPKFEE